jgi:hypothetical protein
MRQMSTRILRSRATMAAALVAFAFAGIGAQGASAASISIKAKPEAITYGQGPIQIKGFLEGDAGVSPGGRTVKLYERPFPYKTATQIATTVTFGNGFYVFNGVQPDLNSTYKVAINDPDLGARSKSQQVVVFADGKLHVRATRDRHIESRFELQYSPNLPVDLSGLKVFWYFNKTGDPSYTIKDTTRTKAPQAGTLTGRSRFEAPAGNYNFRVTYCIDVPNDNDIGVGPPGASRTCPRSFPAEPASTASARAGSGVAAVGSLTE